MSERRKGPTNHVEGYSITHAGIGSFIISLLGRVFAPTRRTPSVAVPFGPRDQRNSTQIPPGNRGRSPSTTRHGNQPR